MALQIYSTTTTVRIESAAVLESLQLLEASSLENCERAAAAVAASDAAAAAAIAPAVVTVVTVADAVAAAAVTVLAAIAAAATITVFTITAVATSDLRSRMLIGRVLPSKLSMPLLASTAIVHERPHQSDMTQEAHKRL
eukprot:21233-Heterococcus_DN1.PRE.8